MATETKLILETVVKGTASARASLLSIIKSVKLITKQIGDSTKSFKDFTKANKETFQKMATFGTAAFAAIGVGVNKTINNAVDLEESINAVNVVFGEGADKIKDFGKESAKTVGLANSDFNQMATITGALFQNVGLGTDEVAEKTIELTKRASDMASVFNTDVSDAMSAINQAVRGETEAIRRYAGDVTDATLQQFLFANGIDKSVKNMTQAEKKLLRVDVIMAQTAITAGDFKNTSDELANSQRILAAETKDVSANFGKLLIPIKAAIVDGLGPLIEKTGKWIEQNPVLTKNITLLVLGFTGMVSILGTLGLVLPAIITGITSLGTALLFLATNPIGLTITVIAALIAVGILLYKNWDTVKEKISETWEALKHLFSLGVSVIGEKITGLIDSAKQWGSNFIQMLIDGLNEKVQAFKDSVIGIATTIKDYLGFGSPTKKGPASDSDEWIPNLVGMISKGFKDGITDIEKAVSRFAGSIGETFNEETKEKLNSAFSDMSVGAIEAFDKIKTAISQQKTKISGLVDEYKALGQSIKDIDKDIKGIREAGETDIATRAVEIQNELQGELTTEKRLQLQEELKLAQTQVSGNDIAKARIQLERSQTQKIIDRINVRTLEAETEKIRIKSLMTLKRQEIEDEAKKHKEMVEQKKALDKKYFEIFGQRIKQETKSVDTLIRKMQQLISLSGGKVQTAFSGTFKTNDINEGKTGTIDLSNIQQQATIQPKTFTNPSGNTIINNISGIFGSDAVDEIGDQLVNRLKGSVAI